MFFLFWGIRFHHYNLRTTLTANILYIHLGFLWSSTCSAPHPVAFEPCLDDALGNYSQRAGDEISSGPSGRALLTTFLAVLPYPRWYDRDVVIIIVVIGIAASGGGGSIKGSSN